MTKCPNINSQTIKCFTEFKRIYFQDSLIYTAPIHNKTGYVSLKENNEGDHVQASLQFDVPLNHVLVYSTELQDKPPSKSKIS